MKNPKLIILYGFASSGKTTLAKRYVDEHPLTIAIEGDQIIGMIGQWRKNEDEARSMVFGHTQSITENHLTAGYDVMIPHLLSDSTQIEVFENIAKECGASFHEIYIEIEKEDAVNRLLERGCWGEEGSRQLTEDDRAMLVNRYEYMTNVMKERTNTKSISSVVGEIEETYKKLLEAIQ
jgi:predicted kinase